MTKRPVPQPPEPGGARAAILAAIRAATQDVPAHEPATWLETEPEGVAPTPSGAREDVWRSERHRAVQIATRPSAGRETEPSASGASALGITPVTGEALLALAQERIADYQATVTRVDDEASIGDAVGAILRRHGARHIAAPADLPVELRPRMRGLELYLDEDPPLTNGQLGALDGVLTGCALAIADTGTIVLDCGPAQGRRTLTLLPDLHVCVIRAAQVVHTVPEAVAALAAVQRPITFISGPSATSDIELDRVEGVHGPRRLEVVLAG
jgi:L-lactate dehydrogenase complex protein LldG